MDGPTTCLDVLGIEIDTTAMEIRLPARKIEEIAQLVSVWCDRKAGTKKEVQSLVGHLCHACKVVRPSRRFLKGMFSALAHAKKSHHFVQLNSEFRADQEWWKTFLQHWNGVSLIQESQTTIQVRSDASGSWGCDGYWENKWFQLKWEDSTGF